MSDCEAEYPDCGIRLGLRDICSLCEAHRDKKEEAVLYRKQFSNFVADTQECVCGGELEVDGYSDSWRCKECQEKYRSISINGKTYNY